MKIKNLILLSLAVCLVSCGFDESEDVFLLDMATIDSISTTTYSLTLDNGLRLWPASSDVQYKVTRNNQRVYINYTTLPESQGGYDHNIKITSITDILTKYPIRLTDQNNDSIGNDPVEITKIWIAGGYINVLFTFGSDEKTHLINLVERDPLARHAASPIELEFRRNALGDGDRYRTRSSACFFINQYKHLAQDSLEFSIKVNEFTGVKTYRINYKFPN